VIILVGTGLRFYGLGAQSLWYDEGVSAWVARLPVREMVAWTAADIQPPLYYLLLGGWLRIAGWSEYALRYPSVFFGVLTVALMFTLLRRWRKPTSAALWAAGLAALHPLLVYYGQEARMYSLLVALSVWAACLAAPAMNGRAKAATWFGYVVAMTLALYTHYFAAFLVVAFAVAWMSSARARAGGWRGFVLAHFAIVLLYLPWIGVIVQRLASDASYWQGRLPVVDAVRDVATRFVAGETLNESAATWLAVVTLAATAIGAVWMWSRRAQDRDILGFAALWLLVPVGAVLMLASFAPKFNPRYVMLALPALLVIWALQIDVLGAMRRPVRWMAQVAAVAWLGVPFLWADANIQGNAEYGKAQWRELTQYLRERLKPDESVVLVSGHAWPVWEYYAPEIEPLRLPQIDVLDVNALLTFENSAGPLKEALALKPGSWMVGWQEEIVDPNDVIPVQLELAAREKGSSARFHQISLRRFSGSNIERIADAPPIKVEMDESFGGQVVLRGYRPLDNGDLLFFWQKQNAFPEGADLRMSVQILDAESNPQRTVADRRLSGYLYPTFRWGADEVVMGRIPASDWLGEAPQIADYSVRISVYDGNDEQMTPLTTGDGQRSLQIDGVRPILE
jgi:hypothetical protein